MTRLRIVSLFFGLTTLFYQLEASAESSLRTKSDYQNSNAPSISSSSEDNERGLFSSYDIKNVKIKAHDNVSLDARLYNPKSSRFPGPRPGLIFINSWTLDEHEYETQAKKFASKGYVVLAYASRGFGGSGGYVSVGGPNDIRDFSTVIDWLEAETQVNPDKIGMAGISYGGGLSLLATAFEPRVKVAASMSGWGNLQQALYRNDTIQKIWLDLLINTAKISGRLDPDIYQQIIDMEKRTDPDATRYWAALRSAETYVDVINQRKVPIFLENSYMDALFPPLQIKSFYEQLEGPKRMMADEGLHASASVPGILGLPSAVWGELHDWMDHFLVDEDIPIRTGVSFQDRFKTDYYTHYPELSSESLKMMPINRAVNDSDNDGRSVIRVKGNKDSGAMSGIPILSDAADTFTAIPVVKDISRIDQRYAAVYQSPKLADNIKVQGAARVNFTLMPHKTPVMLVAYLYDENGWGVGSLLAFSVMSFQDPSLTAQDISFNLNVTSFHVEKGHRLTLAIDTVDSLYAPPSNRDYEVSLAADSDTLLLLPLVNP